jgi:ABC-2 type transport system ATP-binding protein
VVISGVGASGVGASASGCRGRIATETVAWLLVAAIEVEGLVIRYGSRVAVDSLTLRAEAGQVTAVLGPNGAGKTSTVETLEGYRRPAAGTLSVLGLDPQRDRRELAGRVGVMLQEGGVYPRMGPRQALALFAGYYPDPENVDALAERLGLTGVARTPWRRLSGGERQRLSLALALVGKPEVAFLDEPTAGVDPEGRRTIRQVIRELADRGACVVLTTHELEEAARLADRVAILDHGHVVAEGTPSELMAQGGGQELHFGAQSGLDRVALAAAVGAAVTEPAPGEYVVQAAPTPQLVAAVTAWLAEQGLPLADLRAGRASLEDVFLRLTGGEGAQPDEETAKR